MSSEALYEQYKDALKRGHVASLRGRLEDALLAYAEAARIAPERSTPHSSAGTALLRHRRPADALRHYDVALSIAPHDEAALLGRAQALTALDRRSDAADAYDALAERQAEAGKLAAAVDAARRGLELAEGRDRRRTLKRLIARLRAAEPDEPSRIALERALQVLDGLAVPTARVPVAGVAVAAAPAEPVEPPENPTVADEAPAARAPDGPAPADGGSAAPEGEPAAPGTPAESPYALPAGRVVPAGVSVADLATRADDAVDAGIAGPAVEALLDLAGAHLHAGHPDAALDACYTALSFDPDSVDLHLALVELYEERGWDSLAGEKLALVESLARLDADEDALTRVAAVRASRA